MLVLHASALCMELGVVGTSISSLLSELHDPHLSEVNRAEAKKKKTEEVVATSVSIFASVITFCITVIGAGDFYLGVKIAGNRLSAAGRKLSRLSSEVRSFSRRQTSSRNCWSETKDAPQDDEADGEGSYILTGDTQEDCARQAKDL
jgi:hypothetical protein